MFAPSSGQMYGFFNFYRKKNSPTAVHTAVYPKSVCQLSWSRITVYPNNAICNTCPNNIIMMNYVLETQIQQIFDYSKFFVKESQHNSFLDNSFLEFSLHIFFIWNPQFLPLWYRGFRIPHICMFLVFETDESKIKRLHWHKLTEIFLWSKKT